MGKVTHTVFERSSVHHDFPPRRRPPSPRSANCRPWRRWTACAPACDHCYAHEGRDPRKHSSQSYDGVEEIRRNVASTKRSISPRPFFGGRDAPTSQTSLPTVHTRGEGGPGTPLPARPGFAACMRVPLPPGDLMINRPMEGLLNSKLAPARARRSRWEHWASHGRGFSHSIQRLTQAR